MPTSTNKKEDKKEKTTTKKNIKKIEDKKETTTKKNTKKKASPKKQKKSFKEIVTSTKFLSIVFILLLMLVVFLAVVAFSMKQKNPYIGLKPQIVLPIVEENDELGFSINALELSKMNNYLFKLTNYKKDNVINVNIPYTLRIENGTDSVIKVVEEGTKKDLMQKKRSLELKNKLMPKNEKTEVFYRIKMTKVGNLSDLDTINIVVSTSSENK